MFGSSCECSHMTLETFSAPIATMRAVSEPPACCLHAAASTRCSCDLPHVAASHVATLPATASQAAVTPAADSHAQVLPVAVLLATALQAAVSPAAESYARALPVKETSQGA